MVTWFAAPATSLQLSIWIASVGIVIWTLEYLKQCHAFQGDGLFSWSLLKYQHRFAVEDTTIARGLDLLLGYPNVRLILTGRLLAALLLVLFVSNPWARVLGVFGIYLTNLLMLHIWTPCKRGSDGMTEVLFGALVLLQVGGESRNVVQAGLWFIALQVCVSYCANGITKIGKPAWMQGTAVFAIANHPVAGTPWAARFLHPRPGVTKAFTWSAMAMECLFPLVLVVGWPWCWIFLAWGILFHLISTYVIGLNSFFWSYMATYPAVIYVSLRVQELIW
jgi:hypothetical protein